MHTRSMLCAGLALLLLATVASLARASPPSSESVDRLFAAMYPNDMSDANYSKVLPILTTLIRSELGEGRSDDEAAKMYDALAPRAERLIKEQMGQAASKDDFVQIYSELFTQEEIQGLITFYESPSGRAFAMKAPLVLEKTLLVKQKRMEPLMSEIHKMVREAIRQQGSPVIGAPPANCFDHPCK